jgi:hypothetical protein
VLNCYSVTVLECYRVTVLECYTVTALQCYSFTVLQHYSVTALQCYSVIVLECYSVTAYSVTTLQCYSVTVVHLLYSNNSVAKKMISIHSKWFYHTAFQSIVIPHSISILQYLNLFQRERIWNHAVRFETVTVFAFCRTEWGGTSVLGTTIAQCCWRNKHCSKEI